MEAAANLAALVATLLGVSALLPQIAKLRRTGEPAGVSTTWTTLGIVTNSAWTVYLAWAELWLAMTATGVASVLYIVTFSLLLQAGKQAARPLAIAGAWAVIMVLIGIAAGMATLGLVLGLSYVVSVTPGVYGAYRTADPAGIAPGTWLIVLAAGPLWGFYGWFYADTPVMIYAVTATTAASLILIRYATTRPGSRITSPATAPMEAGE